MPPVFHIYSKPFFLGYEMIRKSPKLTLLWFLPSLGNVISKNDLAVKCSLDYCFQILISAWKGLTME